MKKEEKTYRDGLADVAGLVFKSVHEDYEAVQTVIDILEGDGFLPEPTMATLRVMKATLLHLHDKLESDYFVLVDDLKRSQELAEWEQAD